nr:immunoglobulin light chain junction region [Macaca mulatta]MOV63429.1 immunoglobulin light chain junction region [Macaca mulatta]MOW42298.1 immunoglobulin light chain junction region [Macaca mulatta]MOW42521.1 immunoglobulin light chain junction region [Macaca mulatta]MOW43263.1 immunoglobulin light chain junction region [Macaca mulatta]
CQQHDSYPPTF